MGTAIWAVGGKDNFQRPISTLFDKFISNFPFDPIESIVIVRDRDNDTIEIALSQIQKWFPFELKLANKQTVKYETEIVAMK